MACRFCCWPPGRSRPAGGAAGALVGGARPAPAGSRGGVGADRRIDERIPLALVLREETGAPITLRQAAEGDAFILAPVYYGCPQLCTLILNGLLASLKSIDRPIQVVTFSFD